MTEQTGRTRIINSELGICVFLSMAVFLLICFNSRNQGITVFSTANDVFNFFGNGPDITSYLNAGHTISQDGFKSSELKWIFSIWPPGLPTLHSVFFQINQSANLVLFETLLFSVGVGTFSFVYFNLTELALPKKIVNVSILISSLQLGIGLNAYQVLLSDIWAFLFASIFLLLINSNCHPSYPAIALALAAYFRAQFAVSGYLFVLLIAIWYLKNQIFAKFKFKLSHTDFKISRLVTGTLIFILLIAPWHIFLKVVENRLSWSKADNVTWSHVWMPDDYLARIGGSWVSEFGGNWACKIEPKTCSDIYNQQISKDLPYNASSETDVSYFRDSSIIALISNPLAFASNRVEFLWKSINPENTQIFRSLFAISVLIYSLIGIISSYGVSKLNVSIGFFLLASILLPLSVQHLEPRYIWIVVSLSLVCRMSLFKTKNLERRE